MFVLYRVQEQILVVFSPLEIHTVDVDVKVKKNTFILSLPCADCSLIELMSFNRYKNQRKHCC